MINKLKNDIEALETQVRRMVVETRDDSNNQNRSGMAVMDTSGSKSTINIRKRIWRITNNYDFTRYTTLRKRKNSISSCFIFNQKKAESVLKNEVSPKKASNEELMTNGKATELKKLKTLSNEAILRISRKFEKLVEIIKKAHIIKIDKISEGIEEAEKRARGLLSSFSGVKFILKSLEFKKSKSNSLANELFRKLELLYSNFSSILKKKLTPFQNKMKAIKDKLAKSKTMLIQNQKNASHFLRISQALGVQPCPSQLKECLGTIHALKLNSSNMELIKKQFNLSSNRECEIEELQRLKKTEKLVSELEEKFKFSVETHEIPAITRILIDDSQKSKLLSQITSLLGIELDQNDQSNSEKVLAYFVKVKAILQLIEGDKQGSFRNLSSKEFEDFVNRYKSDQNLKTGDILDSVKKVFIETFKLCYIDEINFVPWLTRFCQDIIEKQENDKNQLIIKEKENENFINLFIEMKSEICNLKEQLENKSKFEKEIQKKMESSQDNQNTEGLKIKIKNLQKNVSDLEKKLEMAKNVLLSIGINVNDKDLRMKFLEKMNEFKADPSLIELNFSEIRKKSAQKKNSVDPLKRFEFDGTEDLAKSLSHYIGDVQNQMDKPLVKETVRENSLSENNKKSSKKNYFVKSFLNIGNKK